MRSFVVMIVCLALAGCAAGGKSASSGVLLIPPERLGKGCEAWGQPTALPTASALFKPGALETASGELRSGTLLAAVRFDQDGRLDRLASIGGSAPDSLRVPLELVVRQAIVPDKRYASGSLRVLLAATDSLSITVGRSEYCPPVVVSGAATSGSVTVDMPVEQASSIRPARYSVLVNTSGRIVQSKLIQSSGNRTIDDEILRGFPNWRLRPALLDSVPISAWMDVPAR
jgi:hypothetical protein